MENREAKRCLILSRVFAILTEIFKTLPDSVHHVWGTPTKNHQQALKSCCREDIKEVTELLGGNSDNFLVKEKSMKVKEESMKVKEKEKSIWTR